MQSIRHRSFLKKFGVILSLLFILVGCKETPPEPTIGAGNNVMLIVEDVGVTDAVLRLRVPHSFLNRSVVLKRDTSIIVSLQASSRDTLIIDDNLLPNHFYRYTLILNGGLNRRDLYYVGITTMDTTSHDFTWEIDSLGGTQSRVIGLWGSDENNVYAVGHFNSDSGATSHLAHWDGKKWSYLIPDAVDGKNGIRAGDLRAVFGISANRIWVVGDGFDTDPWGPDTTWGHVSEWNGVEWKNISPAAPHETFLSVWASSENDLWVTSMQGTVYHRTNGTWEKLSTGTDYYLSDIWGFSDNELYITGYRESDAMSEVFLYNASGWYKIDFFSSLWGYNFSTVWGTSSRYMFVGSHGGLFSNKNGSWKRITYPGLRSALNLVRGSAKNNIFIVGHVGKILHYNGISYRNYETQFSGSDTWSVKAIQVFQDKVFIGTSGGIGFFRKGIVLRGERLPN